MGHWYTGSDKHKPNSDVPSMTCNFQKTTMNKTIPNLFFVSIQSLVCLKVTSVLSLSIVLVRRNVSVIINTGSVSFYVSGLCKII